MSKKFAHRYILRWAESRASHDHLPWLATMIIGIAQYCRVVMPCSQIPLANRRGKLAFNRHFQRPADRTRNHLFALTP
jgi:hypothetical protein